MQAVPMVSEVFPQPFASGSGSVENEWIGNDVIQVGRGLQCQRMVGAGNEPQFVVGDGQDVQLLFRNRQGDDPKVQLIATHLVQDLL